MLSSDSNYIEILNNITVYIYRYGTSIVYILGNIGNLLSAFVFLKKSWRKNVCVFYFLICLLLESIYLNSTILGFIFLIGFNINAQNSNIILCKLFYYIPFVIVTLLPTIYSLALIDRLLISSQNVDTRLYSSKRLAYFSISISTLFWIVFNSHLLIKVNLQDYGNSVFICFYDSSELYFDFVYYFLLTINIFFWFLMVILCIFTFKNVHHIRSIPREQCHQIRSMRKKDFQLLRCLFVQNCIYIITNIGSNVYIVYATATKYQQRTLLEQAIRDFLNNLFVFIAYTPCWNNLFIYFIISKAFRLDIKRLIYKIFGKDSLQLRREQSIGRNNLELNIVNTHQSPS